jgi:hypothetical protein
MEAVMQVTVLRQFLNGRQIVHEGEKIEVDERRAMALARHKPPLIAHEIGAGTAADAERAKRMAGEGAEAGAVDPTQSPQDGGPTGEDKPASSSRRGRPQQAPASSGRGGKRGSSR